MRKGPSRRWVCPTFWDDVKVREWSDDARSVALYLLTCPDRTIEGFFRVRLANICDHLRLERAAVEAALSELDETDFARYDARAEAILILKALKFQAPAGPRQIAGAVSSLGRVIADAPSLCGDFLAAADRYAPDFGRAVRERYPAASDVMVATR